MVNVALLHCFVSLFPSSSSAVSYLPMPVVGGYLAYIGYFCLQAGVALCISQTMTTVLDWKYIFEGENALLAAPGLIGAHVFFRYFLNISRRRVSALSFIVVAT
jgi:hypothetical protein